MKYLMKIQKSCSLGLVFRIGSTFHLKLKRFSGYAIPNSGIYSEGSGFVQSCFVQSCSPNFLPQYDQEHHMFFLKEFQINIFWPEIRYEMNDLARSTILSGTFPWLLARKPG